MSVADAQITTNLPGQITLERELEVLQRRLDDGFFKIERAIEAGQDVRSWEQYWIELLHQYETVCAELAAA